MSFISYQMKLYQDSILLESYAKELRVELSLEQLIDSHRSLRDTMKRINDISKEERDAQNKKAFESARDYALTNNWISLDQLRSMSVDELVKLLQTD